MPPEHETPQEIQEQENRLAESFELPKQPPLIVGIAGGSASGKTELAAFVTARARGAVSISQDWYYHDRSALSPGEQSALNFDHPDAFDHSLLRQHLLAIKAGRAIRPPDYDFKTHRRLHDAAPLPPARIIVLEGLLILHDPGLRALLDFSVFVDVPADVRLTRRLLRDAASRGIPIAETLRLYESFVRPMHERFVQPSVRHASVIWSQEEDREFPTRLVRWVDGMRTRAESSAPRAPDRTKFSLIPSHGAP